jgi:hypothetical protein
MLLKLPLPLLVPPLSSLLLFFLLLVLTGQSGQSKPDSRRRHLADASKSCPVVHLPTELFLC